MKYGNLKLNEIFTPDTYVISDHHFGHKFAESFEPCRTVAKNLDGFETFEEMLISRHNEVVGPDDIVVFLGDFAFNSPSNWASKLNGKKYLILGNHDRPNHQAYERDFEHVFRGYHMEYNGFDMVFNDAFDGMLSAVSVFIEDDIYVFCHYPIGQLDEHDMKHDAMVKRNRTLLNITGLETDPFAYDYIIHGHIHSKSTGKIGYINVSCEVIDFRPITIRDLIENN